MRALCIKAKTHLEVGRIRDLALGGHVQYVLKTGDAKNLFLNGRFIIQVNVWFPVWKNLI